MMKNSLNIAAALGPLVFLVILSLLGQGAHALEVPTNMANLNNLRSAANIQHDNRNLHDVPKNYYYHDKCEEAPPPVCDTCGYQRDHDYSKVMVDKWATTEDAQVADGQWYAPSDKTITCGAEITEFTKLTSDLICIDPGNTNDPSSGLVLSGPNAVLDCAKFSIVGPVQDNSASIGLHLQNGATAMNCNIEGFYHAVKMENGDNIFKDSTVVGSDNDNIQTEGFGCMVIDNVETIYSDDNGIQAAHNGVINLYNIKATANLDDGVEIQSNIECANLENVEAIANEDNGIEIQSVPMVGLYGTITSEFNEDDGLELECDLSAADGGCEVKVFADVILRGNREKGIDFLGSEPTTFTVDDCGTVKACENEKDIEGDTGEGGTPIINGDITCDITRSGLPTDFECQDGCFANDVGSGTICQSPVHATCYPKPGW
mmetsp:Transcript_10685/g.19601  ORF Transcript_10685/g.19601 Transcript_10685/m.19601 type:complete len:432 (-) Transcript_10685:199-1494(-)